MFLSFIEDEIENIFTISNFCKLFTIFAKWFYENDCCPCKDIIGPHLYAPGGSESQ